METYREVKRLTKSGGRGSDIHVYVYMYVCVCVCVCVYLYVCVCVCMYVCMITRKKRRAALTLCCRKFGKTKSKSSTVSTCMYVQTLTV